MTTSTTHQLPADWPGPGPIDLIAHDPPHRSSTTEWWYLNTHVTTDDGRQYSLFAAFFALAIGHDKATGAYDYAYSIEWALVDVATRRYINDSVLDRSAPRVGIERIKRGEAAKDPRFGRALQEVFERGAVPLPDRMFHNAPKVAWDRLALDFDGNRLERQDDGSYRLVLVREDGSVGCDLNFRPEKAVVRHGRDGVVRGASAEHMFYYFTPACAVTGTVTVDGTTTPAKGRGWYDHEFGKQFEGVTGRTTGDVGWNWVAAQLSDGWEFSTYNLFDTKTGERLPESGIIAIDPKGQSSREETFVMDPLGYWTSTRTFDRYPVKWRLASAELELDLTLEAEFGAQEFITIIAPPAFWEGRIRITGTHAGKPVTGLGFIERSGFSEVDGIDGFFGAVGRETRNAIHNLLPDTIDPIAANALIAAPGHEHWKDGVDLAQFQRALVTPIREIVDRGGKTWRSYGMLACMDVVGGDSEPYRNWLALPELLHVGSLMVDDVQDRSTTRRGGPSAHVVHGEPLAINAGTACYFLAEIPLAAKKLPPEKAVAAYENFFAAVRAAHAGQALDIDGLKRLMPEVVESGDGELLETRLRATHRLKSAVPPAGLAKVAAILGGGTKEQVDGVTRLFEAFGVAFQIVDDVLNLKGFEGDLKTKGEDVSEGKVTAPIAKAMSRLSLEQRRALWATVSSQPKDPIVVGGVIEMLRSCGALDACEKQARDIIEDAWKQVDPLLPDSFTKTKLRAFGWFVLDRHY